MLDVKLQDVKQTDEISGREIAGHKNAGHEIAGHENAIFSHPLKFLFMSSLNIDRFANFFH